MHVQQVLKCLIVEDSPFMREIYRYALRDHHHISIVAEASDGEEAMKLIGEIKPDILLLDLILPLKNGLDILSELAGVSSQTKTIVITSLEDESTVLKAKALGAIEYIKKPFTKMQLLTAVDEVSKYYAEVYNG